jgi:UDP-N-acetylmuramate dehydrogenase
MRLIQVNIPLAPLTYYKIGGPARFLARPESEADLNEISAFLKREKARYFILGAGSNVLFDDRGFDGLVIHTAKLNPTLKRSGAMIETGAATMVIQLLRLCMTEGIEGFEFLVGVPGNLGGVLAMNAGTKLGEADKAVREITAYDLATGKARVIPRDEIRYSYRAQHFLKAHELITGGKLEGRAADPKKVQDEIQNLLANRKRTQPIDKPSCGSVFKNPGLDKGAWKLIEEAGLRGHRIGNAQISELHTNFIVNLGGAKAADVRALIAEAKARVKNKSGLILEEEVRIVPYDGGKVLNMP